MPLDDDVARLLAELAATEAPALSDGTPAEARANYDASPKPAPEPVGQVSDRHVPGPAGDVPVRLYRHADDDRDDRDDGQPVVVLCHGGGWVLSSVDGHDHFARRVARESLAAVVSVDYRLAPEHPFPAAHDDAFAVTSWLAEHGGEWGLDHARIAVCGDSAGGNIAAGVALRARDERIAVALQALLYPCLDDDSAPYPSMDDHGHGLFLTADDMAWFWHQYVPARHRANPYAVPARAADLTGVAPAYVQTAEFDPLRDEGEAYARRLEHAGVPTTVVRYPGVVHGFATRWHVMARAHEALADLGAALHAALAVP